MNYEYYTSTPGPYDSEGDINYRFGDDLAELSLQGNSPDQIYTYSDGFYDEEVERCAYMLKYLIVSY